MLLLVCMFSGLTVQHWTTNRCALSWGGTPLLLQLRWWDFPPEELADFLPVLCNENLEEVKEIIQRRLNL